MSAVSPSRDKPVLPPGPRTFTLSAHVPEGLYLAAHRAAAAAGYVSLSEYLGVLVLEAVKLHTWHERLRAEQADDPDARSLSDEPTALDEGPPEQPLRERAPTTLPPVDELDEVNPDQPLTGEGR